MPSLQEKIRFFKVEDGEKTLKFADMLMAGDALCLDFRDCSLDEGNQILYFLQGVNYATDGYVTIMKEKVFLFTTKKDLKDPDIKAFIKEYKEAK